MSALPSLVRLFPPSSSTIVGAVAFDETVYVGPAERARIAASCSPKPPPPVRAAVIPTLESAFRRWSGPLDGDATRAGAPSESLSYKVYPPARSSRDSITVRRRAAEPPVPVRPQAKVWQNAVVVLLGVIAALLTVVAVLTIHEDAGSARVVQSEVSAAVVTAAVPAAADPDGLPGVIAPPMRAHVGKPARNKGTLARK